MIRVPFVVSKSEDNVLCIKDDDTTLSRLDVA